MMMWVVWIVIAVALAIAELSSGDFTLLMIAGGCIGGFLMSLITPDVYWLQILVAAITGGLLLGLVRPTLLRRIRQMPGYISSLDRIVGSYGTVLETSNDDMQHVKINGEDWSARSVDGRRLAPGTQVFVTAVDGATVLVMPVATVPPDGPNFFIPNN
ncbi:MAG: NfeD family protein [Propionibacteriaceae bacterium]|jgi:membrane protein implicated in regulation of membrane protease activity|nr:NfeD family protein [Propionibacteriaceae bacterium]